MNCEDQILEALDEICLTAWRCIKHMPSQAPEGLTVLLHHILDACDEAYYAIEEGQGSVICISEPAENTDELEETL